MLGLNYQARLWWQLGINHIKHCIKHLLPTLSHWCNLGSLYKTINVSFYLQLCQFRASVGQQNIQVTVLRPRLRAFRVVLDVLWSNTGIKIKLLPKNSPRYDVRYKIDLWFKFGQSPITSVRSDCQECCEYLFWRSQKTSYCKTWINLKSLSGRLCPCE